MEKTQTLLQFNTLQHPRQHAATHIATQITTHCNTLQCCESTPSFSCNTLQHTATHCSAHRNAHHNTATHQEWRTHILLQHTATHCNLPQHALQHNVTHYNTHCNTYHNNLQHTPQQHITVWRTHYLYQLQYTEYTAIHIAAHTATNYNTLKSGKPTPSSKYNTLQHIVSHCNTHRNAHCNTLQHTATHYRMANSHPPATHPLTDTLKQEKNLWTLQQHICNTL